MQRQATKLDREKVRVAIRALNHEYLFYMLNDAIDLLPSAKLSVLAQRYLQVDRLRPDPESAPKADLLMAVQAFNKASRKGAFYKAFRVNSRNCNEQSTGTMAFIVEFNRLLDRCVAEEKKMVQATAKTWRVKAERAVRTREAFDILFGLLDYIDDCHDDVLFFGDEGGAYVVGVDWPRVLPPWYRLLSATASPKEYAERILGVLNRHHRHDREKMLSVAREIATPEQFIALTLQAFPL